VVGPWSAVVVIVTFPVVVALRVVVATLVVVAAPFPTRAAKMQMMVTVLRHAMLMSCDKAW